MKNTSWPKMAGAAAAAFLIGVTAIQAIAATSGWLSLDGSIRFISASGGTFDWANSGAASPTYTCPAGAVNVSGPGGLFNCGQFVNSTTPPIAPTLTPAAAADPSIISAVFSVDPLASDAAPCAAGDATTMNKTNGAPINTYAITAGSVPAKTDLTNVYAVSHTRANNGHPEIYFAAERLVNNGESHIDFEFLQSVLTLGSGCGSRTMSGSRTEGDLLIAVDFTVGGSLAGSSIYEWHCVPEPGPQPADGTVCDPPAANPSPPEHYELITDPALLAAVGVLVNAAAPVPCGGWACRDTSGGQVASVPDNDFMEGGIDLNTLGFKGCFNTFLPHTRVSQSFNAQLADFTGPIGFRSCRTPATTSNSAPSGSSVAPATSVIDSVIVANGGAGFTPTGTVTFFLCSPGQVTASGCTSGGSPIGAVKTLVAGAATSDPTSSTNAGGKYCWRTAYAPDANSTGVYAPTTHTNATTECFSVAVPVSLPNTGGPTTPAGPWLPVHALIVGPVLLLALGWRRSRSLAIVLIAGVIAGSSPSVTSTPMGVGSSNISRSIPTTEPATPAPPQVATAKAKQMAWRLVIPRIRVDAVIQPVGRDKTGAMESPGSLDGVGWFNQSPSPGRAGDAVIDGHFGLPGQPAVFRNLRLLRPGDEVHVIWPDGRTVHFRVTASETVTSDAHPVGLFARNGPARLSLITCGGVWDNTLSTYSHRLIVTAVPA